MSAANPVPKVGDTLGHYCLTERLGEGGMGTVYRAREEALGRDVAIKLLSARWAGDEDTTRRFLHEAKAVGSLNHPHIVQIYYIDDQHGLHYFAMEYVNGGSIETLLTKRGRFEEGEAVEIIRQAVLGLQHAKSHGIIHRDIKPANLMVTTDGTIKIADFGLAKKIEGTQSVQLTATMAVVGTPLYMSPEQARGQPLDHRSDIYSLGVMFYQFLAGALPFHGDSALDLMMQHIQSPVPPIQQFVQDVSPAIQQILYKMLAKAPNARYQTYDDLLADIEKLYSPQAASVSASSIARSLAALAPVAAHPARKKSLQTIVVIAVLVALVAGGALFAFVSNRKPAIQAPPSRPIIPAAPTTPRFASLQETVEQDKYVKSPLAGGSGGSQFQDLPRDGALLVGLQVATHDWSGHLVIGGIRPIYATRNGQSHGIECGFMGGTRHSLVARDGYAIGGVTVTAGNRMDGLQITFQRIASDGLALNSADAYQSDWIGGRGGSSSVTTTVTSNGRSVLGIYGRKGDMLDSFGFIHSQP